MQVCNIQLSYATYLKGGLLNRVYGGPLQVQRLKAQQPIQLQSQLLKNKITKTSFSKTSIKQRSSDMTNIIKNAVNPYYSEIYNTLNPIPPGPVTLRHYHRKNKQGTCISLTYLSSSTCISNRSQFHSSPPLRSRFSALCFSSNPGNIYPFPKYSNNTHTHI